MSVVMGGGSGTDHKYLRTKVMRTLSSLDAAVQQAGGAIFTYECLKQMTAIELIDSLSLNNIIFKYDKEEHTNG